MPFDPNASFGKSLFFGEILEDQLFPYPDMPRDQAELVGPICDTIDKYMAGIDARKMDREGDLPAELLQSLNEEALKLERNPTDAELVRSIRRIVHTIKGDAALGVLKDVDELYVAKGKRMVHVDLKAAAPARVSTPSRTQTTTGD